MMLISGLHTHVGKCTPPHKHMHALTSTHTHEGQALNAIKCHSAVPLTFWPTRTHHRQPHASSLLFFLPNYWIYPCAVSAVWMVFW